MNHLLNIPGPGQYSPLNVSISNVLKSPTWSLGKSKRVEKIFTDFVPGPGNYNVSKGLGYGPKVIKYFVN